MKIITVVVILVAALIGLLHTESSQAAGGGVTVITVTGDCDEFGIVTGRLVVTAQQQAVGSVTIDLYEQHSSNQDFVRVDTYTFERDFDPGETTLEHKFEWAVDPKSQVKVGSENLMSPSFEGCFESPTDETPVLPSPTVQPTPSPTGIVDCCPAFSTPYPTATVMVTPSSLPLTGGEPKVETKNGLVGAGLFLGVLFVAFGFIMWVTSFPNARRW